MSKKRITIYDLADALNISASYVSRALNNDPYLNEKTKELVQAKARELNYKIFWKQILPHRMVHGIGVNQNIRKRSSRVRDITGLGNAEQCVSDQGVRQRGIAIVRFWVVINAWIFSVPLSIYGRLICLIVNNQGREAFQLE